MADTKPLCVSVMIKTRASPVAHLMRSTVKSLRHQWVESCGIFYCDYIDRWTGQMNIIGPDHDSHLTNRLFRCLVLRELQIYRVTDVGLFTERTGASDKAVSKYAGHCSIYRTRGAIQGRIMGQNHKGQTVKRWMIADEKAAVAVARRYRLPLFSPTAKSLVRQRNPTPP